MGIHATVQWNPYAGGYQVQSLHISRLRARRYALGNNLGMFVTARFFVVPITPRDAAALLWRSWKARAGRLILRRLRGEL